MDNLTHSLVGAALGRAGLYRRTRYAPGALIIGANLPDIDVIGLPFGANLDFRRGMTHGPIAMAILPLVLTGLLILWSKRRGARKDDALPVRPAQLLLLSYIGVFSHPALDWLNSYGVRLLHPFSDRWFYGDSIFIIDLWIWIALGVGVFIARRRAKRGTGDPAKPARLSLAAVAAYVALMITGTWIARRHTYERATMEGTSVASVMAAPVPVNPFVRTVVIDYANSYRLGRVTFTPAPVLSVAFDDLDKNADDPAVRSAVATGAFDDFLYWSRYPYYSVTKRGDSSVVRIGDARFPGFGGVSNSFSRSVTVATPP